MGIFRFSREFREYDKKLWDRNIKTYAPDVGILSFLMLLNDIFLHPEIQAIVTSMLTEKYKKLVVLEYILGP